MSVPSPQPSSPSQPEWPCVVNLRDAQDGRSLGRRIRDAWRHTRTTWRENPRLANSYLRWCALGLLGVVLAAVYLSAGIELNRALIYSSVLTGWALAWAFILGLHLGLVRRQGEPLLAKLGLPNALTLMRFMFVPAVCWPIIAWERMIPHGVVVSIVIFMVGFSDVLDGLLARWLRWQTEFGRYTDHLGDTLICSALALAEYLAGLMPGWLMGIYLFRYGGMFFGGVGAIMFNPTIRITPTWIGRLGTAVAGMVLFLTIAQPLTAPGLKWTMPYLFAATGLLLGFNIVAVFFMLAKGHLARNQPDPVGSGLVNGPSSRDANRRNLPENHVKMQIELDIGKEKG